MHSRLGMLQADRKSLRQVMVQYLNYCNKASILQKFRAKRELHIEGYNLLLFADYSSDLPRKRNMFSKISFQLYQKHIKFMLTYPATLHITLPDGEQRTYQDPNEAELCLENLERVREQSISPQQIETTGKTPHINRQPFYTRRRPRPRQR